MEFQEIERGFVAHAEPPAQIAVGPRVAVTDAGDVVCSYMVQPGLGVNGFVPMLARSADGGRTWSAGQPIFPHLENKVSIFCGVSRSPAGELFLYGTLTRIDEPGESFWSDATQGLKDNDLFWSRSTDGGRTWSEPAVIPMPIPGAAEAPGALCVTRAGRWLAVYSPYNTFDPSVVVDRNQVVVVRSDDGGQTWAGGSMMRFAEAESGAAEAWCVELADGRLLGTTWHVSHVDGTDFPNRYTLSHDAGETWLPSRSAGIHGQATSLHPLPDGRALFVYNQRKHGEVGVWMALVDPTDDDFGIQANQIVWRAETKTQSGSSGEHTEWTDFSFGEPCAARLPDGTIVLVLWCIQPAGSGIPYVRLRMNPA